MPRRKTTVCNPLPSVFRDEKDVVVMCQRVISLCARRGEHSQRVISVLLALFSLTAAPAPAPAPGPATAPAQTLAPAPAPAAAAAAAAVNSTALQECGVERDGRSSPDEVAQQVEEPATLPKNTHPPVQSTAAKEEERMGRGAKPWPWARDETVALTMSQVSDGSSGGGGAAVKEEHEADLATSAASKLGTQGMRQQVTAAGSLPRVHASAAIAVKPASQKVACAVSVRSVSPRLCQCWYPRHTVSPYVAGFGASLICSKGRTMCGFRSRVQCVELYGAARAWRLRLRCTLTAGALLSHVCCLAADASVGRQQANERLG